MNQPEPVCLLIADISGYTEYLSTVEIDHAQDILADLIGTVVSSLRPAFRLAKLEGDAAFCFAPAESVDGSMLLDTIERCYFGFRRRRRDVRQATSCECNACVRIPNLNLKFVAHHGIALHQRMAGRDELLGSDVIVVHRLLKNSIVEEMGIEAYAALTGGLVSALEVDAAALEMRSMSESYDHLGEVQIWVHDLERRWQAEDARERVFVGPDDAVFESAIDIEAPPQVVWELMTTPGRRLSWQAVEGVTGITQENVAGRRGVGSRNHCMHGADTIIEEILDWRPFDYLTDRSTVPANLGGFKFVATKEFVPTPTGTRLVIRVAKPRRGTEKRLFEEHMPPLAKGYFEGIAEMVRQAAEVQSERSADRTEPALPERTAATGFLASLAPIEYVEPR